MCLGKATCNVDRLQLFPCMSQLLDHHNQINREKEAERQKGRKGYMFRETECKRHMIYKKEIKVETPNIKWSK